MFTTSRYIKKMVFILNGSPGYTAEALFAIKNKARELKTQGKELVCSLIMDEMSMKEHISWNGHKNIGYVNFGIHVDSDALPLAKEVLLFLLVGVNCHWKIPIAYFLVRSVSAGEKANLVKECLVALHEVGVKVVSLSFDGAAANLSMATVLGANLMYTSLKTYFLHPCTKHPVFLMLDPCHMLKLIRNTLGDWGTFYDKDNGVISWQYFEELVLLQEREGLHLANKLKRQHVEYENEKMKVRLAAQTFSTSVADALEYCDLDLKHPRFQNSKATSKFCTMVDKMFDILNTRNSLSSNPYKKSLSNLNFNFVKHFFAEATNYIVNLKNNHELIIESKRKTGFLGFIISMMSVQGIIEKYVMEKHYLSYLLTYKLSQDHIEMFFCAIRSRGGFNNNPTAAQFESAYKRLLVHAEVECSSAGNCIMQDDTSILHVSSSNNYTCNIPTMDDIYDGNFDFDDLPISSTSLLFRSDVTDYLAGFIIRKMKKTIKCDKCLEQLTITEASTFINRKNKGGLLKPSAYIVNMCRLGEKVFRQNRNFSGNVVLRLITLTKSKIDIAEIFPELNDHIRDQEALNNHLLQIVHLTLKYFFTVRMHHRNNSLNEIKNRIRQKYNKLVLFQHQ